jgi:hypothetical protein
MTIRLSLKICGESSPVGWIILNPSWPRGADPHLRQCNGCAECEPELYVTHVYVAALDEIARLSAPRAMLLWCPQCNTRHIDEGDFATKSHHTHACQGCGHVWRPAIDPTCGAQYLPGFKNESKS